ncbi:MAG: glutamate synthase-related protein [Thermoplasmata archaeon]
MAEVAPLRVVNTPSYIWRSVNKYEVEILPDLCIDCGICAQVCPYDVYEKKPGLVHISAPKSSNCIGAHNCEGQSFFCVNNCPTDAIRVGENPYYEDLGDDRWPADLITSTWYMAETGQLPPPGIEYRTGDSGGGFDRLHFVFPEEPDPVDEVDTSLDLNRRPWGPRIRTPIPIYGAAMSYGSVSLNVMLSRVRAAKAWGTYCSTGEGGYPEALIPYADNVITQVATGLFGVSEASIQRAPIVEIKYAQGAKPGLGGHLLADKNTPDVARIRETVEKVSLFSPFPFHSVYSVEDHKKHVDWVRSVNPNALIAVKVSTPVDVDMVAVGSYYAGTNILNLDGGYGGTGAAPDIAKKNIAMPIEYAIPKVHRFLEAEGIRDEIVLMASGGLRTAYDVAKAIALGADGAVIGTADLVALNCTRCGNCERGRGCQHGIATTDPEFVPLIPADFGAQRIYNMYHAWRLQWVDLLTRLGLESFRDLRGRYDLMRYEGAIL